MEDNLQPLEIYVRDILASNQNKLPNRTARYWDRYTHLLSSLRENVYPNVNAGLACLSKSPGIYTDHGEHHFDEVIRYAGLLLASPTSPDPHGLEPYELYLLLCAIRLHDAGNIDGRDAHERRVSSILGEYGGSIVHDAPEFNLISNIAEAHGGFNAFVPGDKDTISSLPPDDIPLGGITCRPRHVAALVRFADEVCEHRCRAAGHHIRNGTLPEENKLFHYYAQSISGAVPDRRIKSFRLNIEIDAQYLQTKYPTPIKEDGSQDQVFLIDEILTRLAKFDRERIYCNQFLDPRLQTSQIEVQITLQKSKQVGKGVLRVPVQSFELKIPPVSGYPDASTNWRNKYADMTGEKIAARANEEWK